MAKILPSIAAASTSRHRQQLSRKFHHHQHNHHHNNLQVSLNNTMKLSLASPPFMVAAAAALSTSFSSFYSHQAKAFVANPSSFSSWQKSSVVTAPTILSSSQSKRLLSSSTSSTTKRSVSAAYYDESTTTAPKTNNIVPEENMIVKGEVLSYYTSSSGSGSTLAVVKICEEDWTSPTAITTTLTASGLGAGVDGSVPMASNDTIERPTSIGLEKSLFSKSSSSTSTALPKDSVVSGNSNLKRIIADGDPTGRTVTFANGSKGTVLAHRHPISFVLIDASSAGAVVAADGSDTTSASHNAGDTCSISNESAKLTPSSIPPGSTVDYLGRHVSLLKDGSVCRSLPKAAPSSSSSSSSSLLGSIDGQFFDTTGMWKEQERPIFVSIPKISDIGLIDSPLVTGITAIDALTPIGLGQNMLVIAEGGDDDKNEGEASGKVVNKRGWMMNLLRNVVENQRKKERSVSNMRCYYCVTSGDSNDRSSVWNGIMDAGIQEDIVTLFSNYDSSSSSSCDKNDAILEAAEAVAVAAAACTLGEHHALTTGGDSLVIIDDINLHKSLWDMTTQELVKVYGVNAVVKADLNGGSSSEMRGFFSGLIQRAARYNAKKGGGSVTLILLSTLPNLDEETTIHDDTFDEPTFVASDFDSMSEKIKDRIAMLVKAKVPLTPTNLRKIKLPVPKPSENENTKRLALQHVEDLISMSDGQIWFDVKQDRSPPLDPSRSLTRVGVGADTRNCRADAPALRSVVGSLRFEFQQATDMMAPNSMKGADKNAKQVQRRDAFLLAMHQELNEGRKLSEECAVLLAASRGHLDVVVAEGGMPGTAKGKEALAGMLDHVQNEAGDIMQSIDETLDLSFDERNILDEAISEYFSGLRR